MNPLELLQALLPLLEQYYAQEDESDAQLMGFASWLYRQQAFPAIPQKTAVPQQLLSDAKEAQTETALTMLISFLYRYTKHYAKKALEDTPLSTMDDFTFLATLSYQDSLTKTELIQQHLLEITSGIEIIKRLSKQGWVESFADPNDRRSKRVRLTDQGREMLASVMQKMDQVAHIFAGDLATKERALLMPMMFQLNDFHARIYQQDRKSSLEEIEGKYVKKEE